MQNVPMYLSLLTPDFKGQIVYIIAMYIDTVPNRHSPPAILLREVRRVGKRTVKTTLANLSKCPS